MKCFCWVTYYTKDLDTSIRFYEEVVGMKLKRRVTPRPGTEIAFIGEQGTQVEIICQEGKDMGAYATDLSLGFEVDNLEQAVERVRAFGLEPMTDILSPAPYIRFFYVKEPNGVKIQFVQQMN